jgi:hypothetical protein
MHERSGRPARPRGHLPIFGVYGGVALMPIDSYLAGRLELAIIVEPIAPLEIAGLVELTLRDYLDDLLGAG